MVTTKRLDEVRFVLWGVLFLNLVVAFSKLGYGLFTATLSLQADGCHSLFDGISNVVGLVGMRVASAPPDREHPYGHKKFESLAAAAIGLMLVGTCVYLLVRASEAFGAGSAPQVTEVSFAIMIMTMLVNASIAAWERSKGKALQSEILLADSRHTASDVLVSLSVIVGLVGIRFGYAVIDPIIAILIAMIIAWIAWTVLRDVAPTFSDRRRLDPESVKMVAESIAGVTEAHHIRTRGLPHHIFVDLSIHVGSNISIDRAHGIAHEVEDALRAHFREVQDVLVHIEPEGHD